MMSFMRQFLLVTFGALTYGATWKGLGGFESHNFMCHHFDDLCENVLTEIECGEEIGDRVIIGCPGYPETFNNVSNWKGTCKCNHPIPFSDNGAITTQLISNRLVPDMSWMLEPWSSGPPYDIVLSYTSICQRLLERIDCPAESQENYALEELPASGGSNFKCACGTLSATTQVSKIIMDKMNDYELKTMPIWTNPVYLNVPLSICIVLIVGKIGAIIAVYLKLPPIVGFLLVGLGIQNILNPMFLKGPGYPYPSAASELKLIALVIVLMRAGLAIKLEEIIQFAWPTVLLSLLPYLGEFFVFMYVGVQVFGFDVVDMGLFASIMAPLGPSVVISGLLQMVADPKKDHGYTPKQSLIAAPIEAVIAIIMFGIFLKLEQTEVPPLYPWVKVLPLYANCLLIPVSLIFSAVMGVVAGWGCSKYINYRIKLKTDFIWVRISKNPQMGSSTADLVFVLLVACYTMMTLCTQQYIQQSSGVLVVFVMCITVSRLVDPVTCSDIAQGLKGIWLFAEVFLFTLTGTSLSFDSTNGPLYGQRGLDSTAIGKVVSVMVAGTAGRMVSLAFTVAAIAPTLPRHRQELKWIVPFYFNLLIFQLPKATVQATLGSVAYTTQAIPGPTGLNKGLFIAQCTAFTVLIYAPFGCIITKFVGAPLSLYLERLDKDANWNSAKNQVRRRATLVKANAVDVDFATLKAEDEIYEEIEEEEAEKARIEALRAAAHPAEADLVEPTNLIDTLFSPESHLIDDILHPTNGHLFGSTGVFARRTSKMRSNSMNSSKHSHKSASSNNDPETDGANADANAGGGAANGSINHELNADADHSQSAADRRQSASNHRVTFSTQNQEFAPVPQSEDAVVVEIDDSHSKEL